MRPLDLLGLNLNRAVTIQIKRNQRYVGTLTGFDEHLNMYLENVRNEFFEVPEEEELEEEDEILKSQTLADKPEPRQAPAVPMKHEEAIGNIVLRGDNVIFLRIDRPIFVPRQPQRTGYGKPGYDSGSRRDHPPRREQGPAFHRCLGIDLASYEPATTTKLVKTWSWRRGIAFLAAAPGTIQPPHERVEDGREIGDELCVGRPVHDGRVHDLQADAPAGQELLDHAEPESRQAILVGDHDDVVLAACHVLQQLH